MSRHINEINLNEKGLIANLQRYSIHDGPGIRTLIFMKGCPIRCLWCANPESQEKRPELLFIRSKCVQCGKCIQVCENEAVRMSERGEITIDRSRCKACGKCVTVCSWEPFRELIAYLDFLFYDIKHMDPMVHKRLTGVSNEIILKNLERIDSCDLKPNVIIRIPVIPGLNDSEENIASTAKFVSQLKTINQMELIPYHSWGANKYEQLGLEYQLGEIPPVDKGYMKRLKDIIETFGLNIDEG